ncbi:pectinesterase family protein [Fusibacter sp. 3D3]|uniref:pectinesterase family protein n=1 Tax=Fusibacter sp. 3D3 TaxID=1048380 RepID=UPI0008529FBE|nr:pectinesterase family protein [Fusibacter sp. 3D3]GAU79128.1 rhamnogalacturonan acetylesterase [Fusibacter sp. 3D3]
MMIIVAQDGTGDYSTIMGAVDSICPISNALKNDEALEPITIFIKNGIYKEKIEIVDKNINLIGESKANTRITFDDHAFKIIENEEQMKTFRSYTFFVSSDYFSAENMIIENASGPGERVGQAIALYVDCKVAYFNNCCLKGHQDTLFIGPLPSAPRIPNSFTGPKEHSERKPTYSRFTACEIQGDIDFIFGSGRADFYHCDLISNDRGEEINGYITAASTPEYAAEGFIFYKCNLISTAKENSVFLGRPWRPFAKVKFIECQMGPHIHKQGWDLWGNSENAETVTFAEMRNEGLGARRDERLECVLKR